MRNDIVSSWLQHNLVEDFTRHILEQLTYVAKDIGRQVNHPPTGTFPSPRKPNYAEWERWSLFFQTQFPRVRLLEKYETGWRVEFLGPWQVEYTVRTYPHITIHEEDLRNSLNVGDVYELDNLNKRGPCVRWDVKGLNEKPGKPLHLTVHFGDKLASWFRLKRTPPSWEIWKRLCHFKITNRKDNASKPMHMFDLVIVHKDIWFLSNEVETYPCRSCGQRTLMKKCVSCN